MALYEGAKRKLNDPNYPRTHTRLVVSGGNSPAEKWIAKQDLPMLFNYPYGGAGQTDIIVAKGMIVAPTGGFVRDYDTGRQIGVVTIAKGVTAPGVRQAGDGLSPIGMAPYNFARQVDDRFLGNLPSIITREYIELPYIPLDDDAQLCKWGLVHGNIKMGDYLMVSPTFPGKLTKWTTAYSTTEIVGQALGINDTGSANAWMEWAMWDDSMKSEDDAFINKSGVSAPGDAGYPFDAEYFKGTQDMEYYLSRYTTTPQGIQGLTDGANMRDTLFENVQVGYIPNGLAAATRMEFYSPQKNLTEIEIQINTVPVAENLIKFTGHPTEAVPWVVDMKKGHIFYLNPDLVTGAKTVTITYKAKQYGTPTYWDFTGSVGAVRLLLKF